MLPNNFKNFLPKNRLTIGLILGIILVLIGGFFGYQKFFSNKTPLPEVDLIFDAEGPYAVLTPRRDGNALILNLKRTSSYDFISFELAYVAKPDSKSGGDDDLSSGGVERGVVGEINIKDKKGEYEQEILFGTCSKNVCKYDQGVENGTLTLHIKKGKQAFRMITQWRIQKPDVALGKLASGDEHFQYQIKAQREELITLGYTIINDLTGVPKLPEGRQVFGKVYALNPPLAKEVKPGLVLLELAENPPEGVKLARYSEKDNKWIELDTKIDGSKLSASADGSGIFAVLTPKK